MTTKPQPPMAKLAATADETVQLDVGGQRFAAPRSILTAGGPDSFLGVLFDDSRRWQQHTQVGRVEHFDRDPALFKHVLQHLRGTRDGRPLSAQVAALSQLPAEQLQQLEEEADFFGLPGEPQQQAAWGCAVVCLPPKPGATPQHTQHSGRARRAFGAAGTAVCCCCQFPCRPSCCRCCPCSC